MGDVDDVAHQQFPGLVASEPAQRRVDLEKAEIERDDGDADRRLVEQPAQGLFVFAQGQGLALLVGDVLDHAEIDRAVVRRHGVPAFQPALGAIGAPDAELDAVALGQGGQRAAIALQQRPVGGLDQRIEAVAAGSERSGGDAEDVEHALAPGPIAAGFVDLPPADASQPLGGHQPVGAARHRLNRPLALEADRGQDMPGQGHGDGVELNHHDIDHGRRVDERSEAVQGAGQRQRGG